jgi:hypothetical protein
MRHIYNCEQSSIPRAISSNELSSDTRQSSFDDSIPTPTIKGQFDFTSKARYIYIYKINLFEINSILYRQRLELMRDMYTNAAEISPTSPDRNPESTSSNDMPSDPFYDRFPWFRPIGR